MKMFRSLRTALRKTMTIFICSVFKSWWVIITNKILYVIDFTTEAYISLKSKSWACSKSQAHQRVLNFLMTSCKFFFILNISLDDKIFASIDKLNRFIRLYVLIHLWSFIFTSITVLNFLEKKSAMTSFKIKNFSSILTRLAE